jgi:hypothetical protein
MWLDLALIIFFTGGCAVNHLHFAAAIAHCDSTFDIRFVGIDYSPPREALVLSLQPSGDLYDLDGHPIEDSDLTHFLGGDNPRDAEKRLHIKLMVLHPERVSTHCFMESIEKMMRAAAPAGKTILYIARNKHRSR